MRKFTGMAVTAGALVGLSALVAAPVTAGAQGLFGGQPFGAGGNHAVFVQTDNTDGNTVVAYDRAGDGALTWEHTYPTGGLGGVLNGSVVDHLASQGSLTYDPGNAPALRGQRRQQHRLGLLGPR